MKCINGHQWEDCMCPEAEINERYTGRAIAAFICALATGLLIAAFLVG